MLRERDFSHFSSKRSECGELGSIGRERLLFEDSPTLLGRVDFWVQASLFQDFFRWDLWRGLTGSCFDVGGLEGGFEDKRLLVGLMGWVILFGRRESLFWSRFIGLVVSKALFCWGGSFEGRATRVKEISLVVGSSRWSLRFGLCRNGGLEEADEGEWVGFNW